MKIKKLIILLFVFTLIIQTGCKVGNNDDTKYIIKTFDKDGNEVNIDVIKEYDNYNLSQKQVFNYFYNDIYKHFDYMCFNDALLDYEECYKPFNLYKSNMKAINEIRDNGLKSYRLGGSNNIDKMVYTNLYVHMLGDNGSYKNYYEYSEKQIDKRNNTYIEDLNSMYKDINGFNELTDAQKHYFSYLYNEMYRFKPYYLSLQIDSAYQLYDVQNIAKKIYDVQTNEWGFQNKGDRQEAVYMNYIGGEITGESYDRIYSHLTEDYKGFYDFLVESKKNNYNQETKNYTFTKPAYYDFTEFLLALYFDREDTFELYKYTYDDNGSIMGFTWTNIEEVVQNLPPQAASIEQ